MNTEEFMERLRKLMAHHTLSAAGFADKIGVQRSGVSHLMSGRNKPSLDFILKILEAFPDTDLYWLLTGQGQMFRSEIPVAKPQASQEEKIVVFYPDGTFSSYKPR
ncbi:helix-turn-helix domain-containing protein [Flavobacterium longum]|uniref:helix-turn-helix domain-containing protein n=1 Tax=Flavobacterium longum TaxID=1299340 RepID=UPI0039EAE72A